MSLPCAAPVPTEVNALAKYELAPNELKPLNVAPVIPPINAPFKAPFNGS